MDTFSILTVILYAIGAFQGVVFGVILLRSTRHNRRANRWLAILLFLLSYRLIIQIMRLFGIGYYDTWYYFMLDLSWANGALLYFYVRALLKPNLNLSRKDWLHFLPVLIQMSFSLFVRLQNLYWDGTRESLSWLGYWGYVVWMNYCTIYVVASVLIVVYTIKAERLLHQPIASGISIDPGQLAWIKRIVSAFKWFFALVFLVLVIDLLIYNVALRQHYWYFERFYYYPFFAGISLLTYWVGIEGFRRKDKQTVIERPEISNEHWAQLNSIGQRLQALMEVEALYKAPDLKLAQVAERLEVKPYLLTKCLREIFGSRFSDYINELRVAEVQRLLREPGSERYTLMSLAMDAGFNSKSSFNRAVKKQLGILPSELKDREQR